MGIGGSLREQCGGVGEIRRSVWRPWASLVQEFKQAPVRGTIKENNVCKLVAKARGLQQKQPTRV